MPLPSVTRSLILGLAAFLSIGLLAAQPVRAQPANFTYKVLYSFGASGANDGANPAAGLTEVHGVLYGTTAFGGKSGYGTLFAMTPAGDEVDVYSFPGGADGISPQANLIYAFGSLFGTTENGGQSGTEEDEGTVFKAPIVEKGALSAQTLWVFQGNSSDFADGAHPSAPLTRLGGWLYGTTYSGGAVDGTILDQGVVYAIKPTGLYQLIHTFNHTLKNPDGVMPASGVINVGGVLWGTTTGGGTAGAGTVYTISTTGAERVVCSFHGKSDGSNPAGGLTQLGNLVYGTTEYGGKNDTGTIFSIPVPATRCQKVLHSFGAPDDGAGPDAGLTLLGDTLYGTTFNGGKYGVGSVFALTPATGKYSVLHSFLLVSHGGADGKEPEASLTAVGNTLYGTTNEGGKYGKGTVFAITFGR
jgi:uncharacterized repeat protein (TIGR03803 family)